MIIIAEYLLKSVLILSVLYSLYWLLMRKATHFMLNRAILLFILVASLILPLINYNFLSRPAPLENLPVINFTLEEDFVISESPIVAQSDVRSPYDWNSLLFYLYLGGVLVFMFRLIYQGIYLHVMSKLSKSIQKDKFTIVFMNADITPFAYFNKVFVPATHENVSSLESIIMHERIHQQQWHFFDNLLVQVLTTVQWFNPLAWLFERSLKEVHEYLADEAVLRQGLHQGTYQALLVNEAMGGPVFTLTNNFNKSLIKKRIVMMTKMKTPRWAQVKVVFFVPLCAIIMFAFANPEKTIVPVIEKGKTIVQEDLKSAPANDVEEKLSVASNTIADTVKPKKQEVNDAPVISQDKMPQFPGGVDSLRSFLSKNIVFPQKAKEDSVSGRTIVQFIVDENGKVLDPKVIKGFNDECDAEALRVVKLLPDFSPGIQDGKVVKTYYTLPIMFSAPRSDDQKRNKPLQFADQMPKFPGGVNNFLEYLEKNIKYPETAFKMGIEGRVVLRFVVGKDGKISNVIVTRGIGGGCDEEAVRVVREMPDWIPGKHKGELVAVYFTLPVVFKIEEAKKLKEDKTE